MTTTIKDQITICWKTMINCLIITKNCRLKYLFGLGVADEKPFFTHWFDFVDHGRDKERKWHISKLTWTWNIFPFRMSPSAGYFCIYESPNFLFSLKLKELTKVFFFSLNTCIISAFILVQFDGIKNTGLIMCLTLLDTFSVYIHNKDTWVSVYFVSTQ